MMNKNIPIEQQLMDQIDSFIQNHWGVVVAFIKNNLQSSLEEEKELFFSLMSLLDKDRYLKIQKSLSLKERVKVDEIFIKRSDKELEVSVLKKLLISLKKKYISYDHDRTKSDLKNHISDLRGQDIINILGQKKSGAEDILEFLDTKVLRDVYEKAPLELVESMTSSLVEKSNFDSNSVLSELKKYQEQKNQSFILKKMGSILTHLSPDKEDLLINYLITQKCFDVIESMALKAFPHMLITKLDKSIVHLFFQERDTDYLVDIIYCYGKESDLANIIFSLGDKMSDILQLEIKSRDSDKSFLKTINSRKDNIKRKFTQDLRVFLKNNYEQETIDLISSWIKDFIPSQAAG